MIATNTKRNEVLTYAANPAEGKMHKVRFIKFFDAARNYTRVEFVETGVKVSVPTRYLSV